MLDFTAILPGFEGITCRKEKCVGIDKWLYSYRSSAKAAKEEGFFDLRRSGLRKCAWGLTSLEEINRVTKD